ncbi:Protein dj-1beta [Taenia crassiceps]|uniref:Protein dj-1beta n=1 Tax=Taenia crassiceps TaxID=6207 RepID=A0ABR4QGR7_9CEST
MPPPSKSLLISCFSSGYWCPSLGISGDIEVEPYIAEMRHRQLQDGEIEGQVEARGLHFWPQIELFKMTKTALVLLACGAEELETIAVVDILVRAKVKVVVAGVGGPSVVTCSRGVKIQPDVALADVVGTAFDLVYLPGVLKDQYENKRYIAAICAAPCALKAHEIGKGAKVTSYPSMKGDLDAYYNYAEDTIVEDGHLLTSRGPGTATAFGLRLAELLTDHATAKSVASGMLLPF